jgi:hypothetical protein
MQRFTGGYRQSRISACICNVVPIGCDEIDSDRVRMDSVVRRRRIIRILLRTLQSTPNDPDRRPPRRVHRGSSSYDRLPVSASANQTTGMQKYKTIKINN